MKVKLPLYIFVIAQLSLTLTCMASAQTVNYGTPLSYGTILSYNYTPTLTLSTGGITANRARYLISNSASLSNTANYLSVGDVFNSTSGYSLKAGNIPLTGGITYQNYFSMMLQVVASSTDTSGYYRIDSHLNPNFSIDADSSSSYQLKFRNNLGQTSTPYGYVVFYYDPSTHLLQAKGRYIYSLATQTINGATAYAATYTRDAAFDAQGVGYFVSYMNGAYYLVPSATYATPLYFYVPSDTYAIPSRMNPTGLAYSMTNPAAPFFSSGIVPSTLEASFPNTINSKYKPQVAFAGVNASTQAAANSFLATISATMATGTNGGSLRYSTALYGAFRNALLSQTLSSNAPADGIPGQNQVPFVYFTNEKDSLGVYHPFMNIVGYGQSDGPHGLLDVPGPPYLGAGSPTAPVTRKSNLAYGVLSIPMRNYGLVSTVSNNSKTGNALISGSRWSSNLVTDLGCTGVASNTTIPGGGTCPAYDTYNYASTADNGVLINGQITFPTLNNTLLPSQWKGELSLYGCHVGQGGGGPHCHADGFQTGQNTVTLYGDYDYIGQTHPPLIGFGYDGIALFGVYRPQDALMLGAGTALDSFGGHDHNSIGYHYHAHTAIMPSSYNANVNGLSIVAANTPVNILINGAWAGNINYVPCFMPTGANFKGNQYLGGEATGTTGNCTATLAPAPNTNGGSVTNLGSTLTPPLNYRHR